MLAQQLPHQHLVESSVQLPGEERSDGHTMLLQLAHHLASCLPQESLQEVLYGPKYTRGVTQVSPDNLPKQVLEQSCPFDKGCKVVRMPSPLTSLCCSVIYLRFRFLLQMLINPPFSFHRPLRTVRYVSVFARCRLWNCKEKKTLIQFGWELPQYNISVLTSQGALVCSVSVVVSKLPSRLLYVC